MLVPNPPADRTCWPGRHARMAPPPELQSHVSGKLDHTVKRIVVGNRDDRHETPAGILTQVDPGNGAGDAA